MCLNKTYSEYVSRKYYTKEKSYILQHEEESYKWAYVKIDPVKTEDINTEYMKTEQHVNTENDYREEEDVQKNTKTSSFKN